MRILLPQSAEDAAVSSTALAARGHTVLAIPLVVAERVANPKINLAAAQGFLVTGSEGARALADNVGVRTFPVFCESEQTAAELRRLGFKQVAAAKDEAADLARLVERSIKPADGALVYACSTAAPINLSAMLSNMGFAVRALPLYTLKRVDELPAPMRAALANRTVDAALFTTPDEARAFVQVIQRAQLEAAVSMLPVVAASPVVAAPLRALKLGGVTVPATADPETVIAAFDIKLVDKVEDERRAREERVKVEEAARRTEEERRAAEAAERERLMREQRERAEKEERLAQEEAARARAAAEKAAAEKAAQDKAAREEREAREAQVRAEREAQAALERTARAERERVEKEQRLKREQREREENELRERADKVEREKRERAEAEARETKRLQDEAAREARKIQEDGAREARRVADLKRAEDLRAQQAEREREAAERARLLREQAAAEQAERERLAAERAAAEQAELARQAALRLDRERAAAEHLARAEAERERLAREQREREEKEERERQAAARTERARLEEIRIAAAKSETERLALERAERERLEAERRAVKCAEAERIKAERAEAERLAREQREQAEKELHEQREREETARREQAAAERAVLEAREREERAEEERLKREQREREDKASREQRERAEKELRERLAAERTEAEGLAVERAAQKAEEARVTAERLERAHRESTEKETRERAERAARTAEEHAREQAGAVRVQAELAAQEKIGAEARALARAERERLEDMRIAAARAESDQQDAIRATQKSERKRLAQEQRVAREHAERAAKEEARRLAAENKARVQAERAAAAAAQPPQPGLGARLMGLWRKTPRTIADENTAGPAAWNMMAANQVESPPPDVREPAPLPPIPEVPDAPPSATMPVAAVADISVPEIPTPKEEPVPEVVRDDAKDQPPAEHDTPAALPLGEAKGPPRTGGRAARLQAEDAADLRAKDQRLKYLGFSDTPEPEPERAAERPANPVPPPAPRRGGGSAVVRFVIFAVIAAGLVAVASALLPSLTRNTAPPVSTAGAPAAVKPSPYAVDDPAVSGRLAALEQKGTVSADDLAAARREINERLTALEGRAPSEASEGSVTSLGDSVSNQAKQLAAVTARIATLEAAIGNTARLEDLAKRLNMLEGRSAEANSVLALADRVTALESSARRTMVEQSTNIALLMAVAQWREAVSAGHGFALELQTVKALAARANGLAVDDSGFGAKAARGIATRAELQRRFTPAAAEATRASAIPEGTGAWYRRILGRMMAIVTVRRLDGDAAGMSTSALLARAERRLAEDDLGAAVNELGGLNGTAAQAMAPWLEEASARVATERAIAEATTKAVAAVAATGNTLDEAPQPPARRP